MRLFLPCLWIGFSCLSLAVQAVPAQGVQAVQAKTRVKQADHKSEYLERSRGLPKNDVQANLALATWCKKKRLYPEMRANLVPVLAKNPDHLEARTLLGQLKVGQQWMPKAKAYKAMGYRYYKGSWHSPKEMKGILAEAARKRHLAKLRSDLGKLARALVGPDDKRSEKARDEFLALARKEKLHRLGYKAEKAWYRARKFWREHRRTVRYDSVRGTLAVRAQMTKLLGFDNFTTSLGTGSPVTIQLPRTRSISIGGSIPFGR